MLVLAVCVAPLSSPRTLVAFSLLVVCLPAATRLPLGRLARQLVPLVAFVALAAALLLVVPAPEQAGHDVVRIGERRLPASGVQFLIGLAVRSVVVLTVSLSLTHRLAERDLLEGLIALRVPGRMASLCYLIVRSVSGVSEETRRLIRGRDSRGKPRGLRAVRVAGAMSQVLMVRLARRADIQAMALASRGFTGRFPLLGVRRIRWAEAFALLAVVAVVVWLFLP